AACLERLYRPFLNAGLPVNLAVIPDVRVNAARPDGQVEAFLRINLNPTEAGNGVNFQTGSSRTALLAPPQTRTREQSTRSIGSNPELVQYLRDNPGYHVVQHGCHHDYYEFDRWPRVELASRLDRGAQTLIEAGFPRPETFVAPHDKIS